MTYLKRSLINMALANANLVDGEDGVNVRSDYSGRGMYGGTCFGVDFDRESDSYKFLVSLALVMAEDDEEWGDQHAMDLAEQAVTDSMGRGMIVYFPGVKLED